MIYYVKDDPILQASSQELSTSPQPPFNQQDQGSIPQTIVSVSFSQSSQVWHPKLNPIVITPSCPKLGYPKLTQNGITQSLYTQVDPNWDHPKLTQIGIT